MVAVLIFLDTDRHRVFAVVTSDTVLCLNGIVDIGNIFHIDDVSVTQCDRDLL